MPTTVSCLLALWWINLGLLPGAYQATLSLTLLSRTGGEYKKKDSGVKIKTVWYRKAKAAQQNKESKKNYSLLPTSKRCPAISWEAGPQYMQLLLWKTNGLITNVSCRRTPLSPSL